MPILSLPLAYAQNKHNKTKLKLNQYSLEVIAGFENDPSGFFS
jgi:hypothetical protein